MKGKITAVKPKGFGFIRDEEGRERFFHANNLRGIDFPQIREGMSVEFTAHESGGKANGLRAEDVRVVDAA